MAAAEWISWEPGVPWWGWALLGLCCAYIVFFWVMVYLFFTTPFEDKVMARERYEDERAAKKARRRRVR